MKEEKYDYWYWYEIRQTLLKRDRCCGFCGIMLDKYTITIDHLIPRCLGGSDELNNLVAACKSCNNAKDNMLPLNFIIRRIENVSSF